MDLDTSRTASYEVSPTLFKRHKVLPHPQNESLYDLYPSPVSSKPRVLKIVTGSSPAPSSQTSSPPTLKHASKRIGIPDLPPTPPTHSRQSSSGNAAPETLPSCEPVAKSPSIPSTPPNPNSPPTPDVTPPRATKRPMALRPPASDRYSSSRTDSFRTAREFIESSDDDEKFTVRPALPSARPSARPSEASIPRLPVPVAKPREIGLGLGLEESEDEGTPTPTPAIPDRLRSNARSEFGAFDGAWSSSPGEVSEVEREWDDNLMRNVTVRRRNRKSYIYDDTPRMNGSVLDDNIISPTAATKHLRGYSLDQSTNIVVKDPEHLTSSGRFPEPIAWSRMTTSTDFPSTPDLRRFSTMSGKSANSTVVEAMVVDFVPRRQKTLRHTKKQLALREFSSDTSTQHSGPESVVSHDPRHRLIRKTSRIPDRIHKSMGSSVTVSTSSSAKTRKDLWSQGSIPVVVVPERRSSMKSARTPSLRSTSSRRTKRSMSLTSAPLSASSKSNNLGYFDLPTKKPRRMSESVGSSAQSVRTIDFPPTIPVRRSSLSAPTSRNTSRAGSLTADSLRAHDISQAIATRDFQPPQDKQPATPRDVQQTPKLYFDQNLDANGDPFFGNRLSAQVTPFSQYSYETTGTVAELSEAMAVNIYPHQNKSILMVQHQGSPTAVAHDPSEALNVPGQPLVQINGSVTRLTSTPPRPIRQPSEVDSPLRNPRNPPQPPVIKFIPPTPAELTPAEENDHQLGMDVPDPAADFDEQPKRGFSLRRAISNRRYQESLIRSFSLRRRLHVDESTQTSHGNANPLYPSVADQPADGSKLHPFWRPARFWDDLEDADGYFEEDGYPPVDNRPPPPKRSLSGSLKRTFAILPRKEDEYEFHPPFWTERRTVRRSGSGNLRVVKQRSSRDSLGPATPKGHRRVANKTADGDDMHAEGENRTGMIAGWKGLGRRMSERRRERRNDKIRRMISGPRDAVDGVDNILKAGAITQPPQPSFTRVQHHETHSRGREVI
jgi:hypothetical protein